MSLFTREYKNSERKMDKESSLELISQMTETKKETKLEGNVGKKEDEELTNLLRQYENSGRKMKERKVKKVVKIFSYIFVLLLVLLICVITYGIIITNLSISVVVNENLSKFGSISETVASFLGIRLFGDKNSKEEIPKDAKSFEVVV